MTPAQVELVKTSFDKVAPIADKAAVIFYDRLFAQAPEVRPLFADDMAEQQRKLMAMLAAVVSGLSKPQSIEPMVRHLGARHSAYGAVADHYPVVGEALVWTLRQGLGEAFDSDTEDAWIAAYSLLSGMMIKASEKDRRGKPV